jgi:hypothetical protein
MSLPQEALVNRLIAIAVIWMGCTVAWVILGMTS